jgi:predicted nucleic acid-binding protein
MILKMRDIAVITDTSCLIALTKAEAIDLLRLLYRRVIVTEEIFIEFGDMLPDWIEVKDVVNKKYQQLLELILDKGEASAIALAIEIGDVLLIVDDLKARKEVKRLGLQMTGTLGVLYAAKQKGLITKIKPYIDMLQVHDFRIAPNISKELLRLCGE